MSKKMMAAGIQLLVIDTENKFVSTGGHAAFFYLSPACRAAPAPQPTGPHLPLPVPHAHRVTHPITPLDPDTPSAQALRRRSPRRRAASTTTCPTRRTARSRRRRRAASQTCAAERRRRAVLPAAPLVPVCAPPAVSLSAPTPPRCLCHLLAAVVSCHPPSSLVTCLFCAATARYLHTCAAPESDVRRWPRGRL